MDSEALRNIRTMRQVKTSLDVARNGKVKTTNHLSRTEEEIQRLECPEDGRIGQILAKERARANSFEASVEKSRRNLLKSREKLAVIVARNRALTRLRHERQQARGQRVEPTLMISLDKTHKTLKQERLNEIELRY
jgi:hypothetical protein